MEIMLAENIRRFRKERGLTQEQIAEALGVTVEAVYKWESGHSMPKIRLLVEIAAFFETSVDVLLGYDWDKTGVQMAVQQITALCAQRKLNEVRSICEKALQKHPNRFDVVFQSGMAYMLMLDPQMTPRAIELLERACKLIDQNTCEEISEWTIRNHIAGCYADLGRYEEAVSLYKKNNFHGINNALIGSLLAQHCQKPKEALEYLSAALGEWLTALYRISIGYANAYEALDQPQQAQEIMKWALEASRGLHEKETVTYLDKGDVWFLLALAELCAMQEKDDEAIRWMKEADRIARRFDAAPSYTIKGLKYYHGRESTFFDDFGNTAAEGIQTFLAKDTTCPRLRLLWERIAKTGESD